MKKLSIIIPAYNEERSISQILGKIHQTRLIGETEKEILIIDDGSKDSTAEKCRQFMQAHPDLDIHYHLTSSMRTPKPIIKQWCDPLMTFHKHCSCYSLLTLR